MGDTVDARLCGLDQRSSRGRPLFAEFEAAEHDALKVDGIPYETSSHVAKQEQRKRLAAQDTITTILGLATR
eukprot:3705527-Prymnesium_polylepis.3